MSECLFFTSIVCYSRLLLCRDLYPHGVDVVVWLLRRHMLQPLHHFFVQIPPSINGVNSPHASGSSSSSNSQPRRGKDVVRAGQGGKPVKYYDTRTQYQVNESFQCYDVADDVLLCCAV